MELRANNTNLCHECKYDSNDRDSDVCTQCWIQSEKGNNVLVYVKPGTVVKFTVSDVVLYGVYTRTSIEVTIARWERTGYKTTTLEYDDMSAISNVAILEEIE